MKSSQKSTSIKDVIIWVGIIVALLAAIVANFHYTDTLLAIRILAWLGLVAVLAVLAKQTAQGQVAFQFIKEARNEVRKVYWPTRQEVLQTTLIVVVVVLLAGVVLWGIDYLLMLIIGFLTGQRG